MKCASRREVTGIVGLKESLGIICLWQKVGFERLNSVEWDLDSFIMGLASILKKKMLVDDYIHDGFEVCNIAVRRIFCTVAKILLNYALKNFFFSYTLTFDHLQ